MHKLKAQVLFFFRINIYVNNILLSSRSHKLWLSNWYFPVNICQRTITTRAETQRQSEKPPLFWEHLRTTLFLE